MMRADVFVSPSKPVVPEHPPKKTEAAFWSPTSATLISGEHDAVLVDALMTMSEVQLLGDWIESLGKRLTTIYLTHGHGDHFFGIATLLKRFPDSRALAAPRTVEYMKEQIEPSFFTTFWESRFPGQIAKPLVVAETMQEDTIFLEGYPLRSVQVGQSDTHDTTVLHVPDLKLVVAGDVAYNDVHLYLAESTKAKRRAWLDSLDKVAELNPTFVIAGHKRPGSLDSARVLDETRRYIEDFDSLLDVSVDPESLVSAMLLRYPFRVNQDPLWNSARAVFARGKDL